MSRRLLALMLYRSKTCTTINHQRTANHNKFETCTTQEQKRACLLTFVLYKCPNLCNQLAFYEPIEWVGWQTCLSNCRQTLAYSQTSFKLIQMSFLYKKAQDTLRFCIQGVVLYKLTGLWKQLYNLIVPSFLKRKLCAGSRSNLPPKTYNYKNMPKQITFVNIYTLYSILKNGASNLGFAVFLFTNIVTQNTYMSQL